MVKADTQQHIEPVFHLLPEIRDLLKEGQWSLLKELLEDISPLDLADSWHQFSPEDRQHLFRLLDQNAALVLFESLPLEGQTELLKRLEDHNIASVLENIPSKDVAEIFHKIPDHMVKKMVSLVKQEEAVKKIKLLMTFAPDTAGALMYPEFIKLTPRTTCRGALSLFQSVSRVNRRKHLRALYVTSAEGTLLGKVTIEDLLAAPPDSCLGDWMTSVEPIKIRPETDQERVAVIFSKYDLVSAPVVDEAGTLLGTILIDDIVDVISAEATEDIAKMAGTRADELSERSSWRVAWFRAPWLLATLATQIVVGVVMRHFEFAMREILALATFVPLVAAMGGNVGTQSATIFVRSLAIGRLRGRTKHEAVLKEIRTGFLLGLGYGTLVGLVAYILYGPALGTGFAWVVGAAVCIAITWAAAAGVLGPLILERMGADPAQAVGPMVTSTTDLFSITIYFSLATVFLIGGGLFE